MKSTILKLIQYFSSLYNSTKRHLEKKTSDLGIKIKIKLCIVYFFIADAIDVDSRRIRIKQKGRQMSLLLFGGLAIKRQDNLKNNGYLAEWMLWKNG